MTGATVLQVAIGLALVYLIFSLFCSAIQEWIARLCALRAKTLRGAINQYLSDPASAGGNASVGPVAQLVHDHPLIKSLYDNNRLSEDKYPNYIPTQHFVMALLNVAFAQDATTKRWTVKDLGAVPGGAQTKVTQLLNAVITGVEDDTALVQQRLGKWFDDSMERTSGLYKRNAQVILLVISLVVVAPLNIDTIGIVEALWTEPTLRNAMNEQATQIVMRQSTNPPKPEEAGGAPKPEPGRPAAVQAGAVRGGPTYAGPVAAMATPTACRVPSNTKAARTANDTTTKSEPVSGIDLSCQMAVLSRLLPIGWRRTCPDVGVGNAQVLRYQCVDDYTSLGPILLKLLGFVLSAIALSLGAPFWFDALSRISNVRQTGTPPDDVNKRQAPVVTSPATP